MEGVAVIGPWPPGMRWMLSKLSWAADHMEQRAQRYSGREGGSAEDAARFGDVVLDGPFPLEQYRRVPGEKWLEGKVVMDANNYYPNRDGHIRR